MIFQGYVCLIMGLGSLAVSFTYMLKKIFFKDNFHYGNGVLAMFTS